MITLDTTGPSLFKRGYRLEKGGAPLKENMAAALVMLTNWRKDRPFYDPVCGSGTICIEAALIGHNIAPGFNREFACESWDWFSKDVM
ncbi:class I SAM-dependent RNA methyltransferase, partial [Vibrio parahaemolyticus]|nr:class I SAM-dependent RNA methyltransferase [Vibrio parahaemolyticus]